MKFGKYIQSVSQEWATPYYINYKALKKIIGSCEEEEKETPAFTLLSAADPPGVLDKELSNIKTAFFYKLERELEKVNEFYLQKEIELKLRLDTLIKKKSIAVERYSLINLKEAFLQFQIDLAKLQKFVQLNATGFRKILKKWDKRAKSSTKEIYLSRQIQVQPCFNTEVLTDLADIVAQGIADIEKHIETANISEETPASHSTKYILRQALVEISPILNGKQSNELKDWIQHKKGEDAIDSLFYSRTFLEYCNETSLECLRLLLETQKIDCNLADDISDHTCLHELSISGNLDGVKLVLEYKAKVDSKDVYGRTALHYAGLYGHSEICLYLISKGANVNAVDQDDNSPLINAIIGGHFNCASILISKSARFEPLSNTSPIPLSIACQYGHLQIVDLLLSKGAKMIANIDGLDPLHLSCREGKSKITKRLIEHGANIESKDSFYGFTPVFFAAQEGHEECIKLLLDAGCNINIKDQEGWLPWTYALYRGHIQVASLLKVPMNRLPLPNQPLASNQSNNTTALAPSQVLSGDKISDLEKVSELDLDDIPSLSLPPPIIPLRIYGHHYLENKYLIQLQIGEYRRASHPSPVRLFGSRQLSSIKLKITCKPQVDIAFFANLPLKDALTSFECKIEKLENLSFEFDIYPAFGTKPLGRASATNSLLKSVMMNSFDGVETQECIVSIFDSHLRVIGELSFLMSIIKPFVHPSLQIGGKIETYWKSTTVINNTKASNDAAVHSLITSSSLSEEYIELVCQPTKDGVIVVYPDWFMETQGIQLAISSLNYKQAKLLFTPKSDINIERSDLVNKIYDQFLTLEECLNHIPEKMGVSIILKYPTPAQRFKLQLISVQKMDDFVDRTLQLIYNNSKQHSLIFSSFNKNVCSIMNWKQPNYGVFLRTNCGIDINGEEIMSIKESIKFCKKCDLLGVICHSKPFVEMPVLTQHVKESGLILATFGELNMVHSNVIVQQHAGVDAIVHDYMFKYNNSV